MMENVGRSREELLEEVVRLRRRVYDLQESLDGRARALQGIDSDELEGIAEDSSDLVARLDTGGRFVYVNRAVERATGIASSEFPGRTTAEAGLPQGVCERLSQVVEAVRDTGQPGAGRLTLRGPDGERTYRLQAVPEEDGEGRVEFVTCIARAASDGDGPEQDRGAEPRGSLLLREGTFEGAYVCSQDYEVEYVSPSLIEDFGPVEGRKCHEYFYGREAPCPYCNWGKVLRGETIRGRYHYQKTSKTYEVLEAPLRGGDGRVSKVKTFHDVTRRRRVQESLQEERELLKEVLLRIPAGVCIVDASTGELELWNERAREIWRGSVSEDSRTRTDILFRLFRPDGRPVPDGEGPVFRAVEHGEIIDKEEFLFQRADGSMANLLVSSTPIRNEKGEITAGVSVFTDITDRKRVEEGLKRTSQQLDERVRRRTAQLVRTNEALQVEIAERERAESRIKAINSILKLFINAAARGSYLQEVTDLLRKISDCQCVGIRMKNDQDEVPYEASVGFSRDFLEAECRLHLGRDQCVCTHVISQRCLPQEAPSMTPAGSFFCNDTADFMRGLSAEEKEAFRGKCMETGFMSVAVIPIWYHGQTVGAVHLADPEPAKVPADMVRFIEGITPVLGEAIHRFQVEKHLRDSNTLLERIFDTTHVLIAYLDPDCNFIRVNRAYAQVDGRPQRFFPGKNHFDLYPHEENERIFRRVVRTGEPFFVYAKPFKHPRQPERGMTYWDWSLLPVKGADGQVEGLLLTLRDVTERVRAHEQLRNYQRELRSLASELSTAEELERRRIATDLHDDVGQTLALAQMRLGALQSSISDRDANAAIGDIRNYIEQSLQSTRSLTFDLSPPILYEMGLEAALERLSEKMGERHGIAIECDPEVGEEQVPTEVRVSLYRAARELLINAVKHSGAGCINVSTRRQDGAIFIEVNDDGEGFDPDEVGFHRHKEGGFGLFHVRERIEHLGGRFELDSCPGEGTSATLAAPLDIDRKGAEGR